VPSDANWAGILRRVRMQAARAALTEEQCVAVLRLASAMTNTEIVDSVVETSDKLLSDGAG
jgi:hypothetical protein